MVFRHKSKILFVFSDPGGAKPCLALIDKHKDLEILAVSDRVFNFYKDFNVDVLLVKEGEEAEVINTFKPTLIFTGTSYTSDIEQRYLKKSREMGILCYSFVDHWTAISQRFLNKNKEMIIPNEIWVLDERAKGIAVDEGLPADVIKITGNPYHEWLRLWTPKNNKFPFFYELGLKTENQRILVFAPDPLSNVNGMDTYGFDELSGLSDLLSVFREFTDELEDWMVVIKPHPNQDISVMKAMIDDFPKFILVPAAVNMNEIMFYGDVIMGFFSAALLEADIMKKPILRFLPKEFDNDPFKELKIGQIVNKKNFVPVLLKLNNEIKK